MCFFFTDQPLNIRKVNVTMTVVYQIGVQSCNLAFNLYADITMQLRNFFSEVAEARFNSSRSFCSSNCENLIMLHDECKPRTKRDLTHTVTLEYTFFNIRFVLSFIIWGLSKLF